MAQSRDGRLIAGTLCAALFILFGYALLVHHQEGLLTTAQWVLSGHRTHYLTVVSPVVVLSLLTALAIGIERVIRPITSAYACVYAPSLWLLALFTDITLPVSDGTSNGFTWVGFLLWGLLVCAVLWLLAHLSPRHGSLRRTDTTLIVLGNLMCMTILLSFTALATNTRAHIHNTLTMSQLAAEERYEELLAVGQDNAECNRSMCAMRAYALSCTGQLPDKLFAYPQHHGVLGLIPPQADSSYTYNWPLQLYRRLGSACANDITTPGEALYYLRTVAQRHPGRTQIDYLLCGLLLERRLDEFATELTKHYALNDSLPRHYKEALAVYQRRTAPPSVVYHDNNTEAHLAEFLKFRNLFGDKKEQEFHIVDMYPETYWCYYYYPSRYDK